MMRVIKYISVATLAVLCVACGSHRGSSSLGSSSNTTTVKTTSSTPKVKSDEQLAADKAAAEQKAKEAKAAAEAAAQKLKEEAEAKAKEAEAAAQKALAEAKAKAAEEEAKLAAAARMREEQVKVVEIVKSATASNKESASDGKYHVVIGSFGKIENARNLAQTAMEQGYTPSIMENADGMYRVSVLNANTESVARTRLAQIKMKHPEYADAWLLVSKK